MNLRPLNDRILVKPDAQVEITASGLHLSEHWKPEQSGTIVALGRFLSDRQPPLHVGDAVVFSWMGGQEIRLEDDGERYLILREDDLLAVIEE